MDVRLKAAIERGKAIKLERDQNAYQKKIDRRPIEGSRARKWIDKFLFKLITKAVSENNKTILLTSDYYRMPSIFKFSLETLYYELKKIEGLNVEWGDNGKGMIWKDNITINLE